MSVRKKLLVTRRRFLALREEFHDQVSVQQQSVLLEWNRVSQASNSLDKFRGDSPEFVNRKRIKCLFDLTINAKKREKYGISEDISCVVWLSPIGIKTAFGTQKLPNDYQFTVVFQNERYVIESARYLEEMYGSYIGVQLNLKTDRKGG